MKLFGYKFNGYLVILGIVFVLMLSGTTCGGCMRCGLNRNLRNIIENGKKKILTSNANDVNSALHIDKNLRNNSLELAHNNFIRSHYFHNKKNYKNVPCTKKQLNMLYTRGGNSNPTNVF
jgi:hypothetical protein